MSANDSTKKRASRFRAGLPAELHVGDRNVECSVDNLSRTGLLLAGELPPPGDGEVRVTVRSTSGDIEMTVAGRVARFDEHPETGDCRLAIEFRALDAAAKGALESLLSRVIEGVAPSVLHELPPDASVPQIREALDKIALAHRIQLASRGMAREREILIHDSNPQVIDALARNPNLIPPEVQALLRMPTLLPRTLDALARDGKWSNEVFRVKIAGHPNTTYAVADRIVAKLSPGGLQKLILLPGLNSALRNKLLREKKIPNR